jgi:hypothetical protein
VIAEPSARAPSAVFARARALAGVVGLVVLAASAEARAADPPADVDPRQPPLVFVADPRFGMEGGIRTTESLGRLVFRYELALPEVPLDETRSLGKAAAFGGRLARWIFVDTALAQFEETSIHEVFGHGARARDLGQSPGYTLRLPAIYCAILGSGDRDGCRWFTESESTNGQRDRDLLVTIGGLEANAVTAWWIDEHMVASDGWIHHGDLLVYAAAKLEYAPTFLSTKLDVAGGIGGVGDDVDSYVSQLQDRFNLVGSDDRRTIASRLRTAYLWNLADPMLVFAAYGTLVHLARGDRYLKFPIPSAWGVDFYPSARFAPSPFGAEHALDLFAAAGSLVVDLYGRTGTSGLARYSGGGLRFFGLHASDRVELGGELDVWNQPETLLDVRDAFDRPQLWGMNAGASADVVLTRGFGLTARLAYKTAGWLAGQPIEAGLHGYAGVTLALGR